MDRCPCGDDSPDIEGVEARASQDAGVVVLEKERIVFFGLIHSADSARRQAPTMPDPMSDQEADLPETTARVCPHCENADAERLALTSSIAVGAGRPWHTRITCEICQKAFVFLEPPAQ
jgi:hypothetical protein